jgi:hypothetical protein
MFEKLPNYSELLISGTVIHTDETTRQTTVFIKNLVPASGVPNAFILYDHEQLLSIEIGKTYKSRDGNLWTVTDSLSDNCWACKHTTDDRKIIVEHNGKFYKSNDHHDYDLVEHISPPVKYQFRGPATNLGIFRFYKIIRKFGDITPDNQVAFECVYIPTGKYTIITRCADGRFFDDGDDHHPMDIIEC